MTEAVKGKPLAEIEQLFERFHAFVTATASAPAPEVDGLGKLAVFGGVREFPMRVKCATLSWHALRQALHEGDAPVSTE